jgi:hypothetical protein
MKVRTLFIAFLLAVTTAGVSSAQIARPERPYRGLFGGGVGNTEQILTATASLSGGYDDNVLAPGGDYSPQANPGSRFGSAATGLSYSLSRDKVSFGASGSVGLTYYPTIQSNILPQYLGSVGGTFHLSSRTRLQLNQAVGYQVGYAMSAFIPVADPIPGQVPPINETLLTYVEPHTSYDSTVSLSQSLTSRLTVSADYGRRLTTSPSGIYDLSGRNISGRLSYAMSRGLSARVGYGVSRTTFGAGDQRETFEGDSIDAGLDFARALSLTRRTSLSFSAGTTAISAGEATQYTAVGHAQLNREIGRSWNASLSFGRDVDFVESLRNPVFTDGLTAGLGGLLNRKIQVQASTGVVRGNVGLGGAANGYLSYFTTAGLNFGLTRTLALGVDYTYYRYEFEDGVELPTAFGRQNARQSFTANLSLWVPLLQRTRRSNASR